MGTIKQGILGGFSGKVGPVVGSSWKGIAVIKTKPLSVANPKTAGQVTQRDKFTNVVEDARTILTETIKPLWDRFAQKMSGYNAFVQENIQFYSALQMSIPADVKMSIGSLVGADGMAISYDHALQEMTTDWVDNSGTGNALGTDKVFSVMYNATENWIEGFASQEIRTEVQNKKNNGKVANIGDTIYVWLCFLRADGSIVSTSNVLSLVVA